jgi:protein-tyrosine-phosphatase
MSSSLNPAIKQQLDWMVKHLCGEFDGTFDRPQIQEVMDDSVQRIVQGATVFDYVPLLAYRFTRERLNAIKRAEAHDTQGTWDVVFVSLSGGGRGQIAAALTTLLSENRVCVHSAGTAVHGQIDPNVRAVIAELGIDPDQAFARPVTNEVLRAADVIVTMGHSVGVIDLPDGVRHDDWRVGDPIGAPIGEIRRVRVDIEHRVRTLLTELGAAPCHQQDDVTTHDHDLATSRR